MGFKVVRLMPRPSTVPGYIRNIKRADCPTSYTDEQALQVAITENDWGRMEYDPVMRRKRPTRRVVPHLQTLAAAGDYSITIED